MATDEFVIEVKEVGQLAHLKTVTRGEHYATVELFQLLDDGDEKGNVGRVIQIDPDLSPNRSRSMAFRLGRHTAPG